MSISSSSMPKAIELCPIFTGQMALKYSRWMTSCPYYKKDFSYILFLLLKKLLLIIPASARAPSRALRFYLVFTG